MSEKSLMSKIKSEWGAFIVRAVAGTPLPEAFIAALIAGESGGSNNAKRFEPGVYRHLVRVQAGLSTRYGVLAESDLSGLSDEALRGLATSWGATQVMGYNALCHGVDYLTLETPGVSMALTVRMLLGFAKEFNLDPAKDFGALFKCWNTGRPDGKTSEALYAYNGLGRMRLYAEV